MKQSPESSRGERRQCGVASAPDPQPLQAPRAAWVWATPGYHRASVCVHRCPPRSVRMRDKVREGVGRPVRCQCAPRSPGTEAACASPTMGCSPSGSAAVWCRGGEWATTPARRALHPRFRCASLQWGWAWAPAGAHMSGSSRQPAGAPRVGELRAPAGAPCVGELRAPAGAPCVGELWAADRYRL